MSATATQVATRQDIAEKEWVKLFPKQVIQNYTSSVTFIKQLTVVAMSTITYLKNAFPEHSYNSESFAGLRLKLLKEKCADDMAQFLTSSLKNVFHAFDRKYVHQLALCFYDGNYDAEKLIEYHIFEYSYKSEGVCLNVNSRNRNNNNKSMQWSVESVQNRTIMLVRALLTFVHQNCQDALPLQYDISLRIYYNEDTPEDYQAPGFSPCTGPDPISDTLRSAVRHGRVDTPYHTFVVKSYVRALEVPTAYDKVSATLSDGRVDTPYHTFVVKSYVRALEVPTAYDKGRVDTPYHTFVAKSYVRALEVPTAYDKGRVDTPYHTFVAKSYVRALEVPTAYDKGRVDTPYHTFVAKSYVRALEVPTAYDKGRVDTPYHTFVAKSYVRALEVPTAYDKPSDAQEMAQDDDFNDGSMNCEGNSEPSLEPSLRCPCGDQVAEDEAVIICRYCHTRQHAACFGLMAPITEHCCADCAEKDPSRKATCETLKGLKKSRQAYLCVFRRTLAMCSRQSSVTGEELMAKFNFTAASAAKMIRLLQGHHILPTAVDPSNLIVVRRINRIQLKESCKEFFQMEESIVDRVIAETEATDPVEEALSPIEKISLKETNMGTVIDRPALQTTPLKEFSEVQLPFKDISEELPLSGPHNPVRNVPRPEKRLKRKKIEDEDWTPKVPKLRSGASRKRR
ncbi:uncharacterized protein LOC133532885 [Cydia pomonella]|uniref:uncharacterized protein LOC133532885 n=1 Tax=Cydia pomonella TaxID=82600 RepID=UPI002ADD3E94|nr:uncharacterized protein LOC133532885 [Cydia pomonella]